MKKYKSHKEVEAFKIKGMFNIVGNSKRIIGYEDEVIKVDITWIENHRPEVGGYLVKYKDGYLSYSPAKVFEEGYTEIIVKQKITIAEIEKLMDNGADVKIQTDGSVIIKK